MAGGEEASFLVYNIFQRKLDFPLTTLYLLEVFLAFRWVRERVGCEDVFLSHPCSSLLLKTVFVFFLLLSSQSGKTKCGDSFLTTILMLMQMPGIINCAG